MNHMVKFALIGMAAVAAADFAAKTFTDKQDSATEVNLFKFGAAAVIGILGAKLV